MESNSYPSSGCVTRFLVASEQMALITSICCAFKVPKSPFLSFRRALQQLAPNPVSAAAGGRLPLLQRDGRRQLQDDRQLPHQLD